MVILFKTKKLQKLCNEMAALQRKFGAEQAKKIRRRLDDLQAAESLEQIKNLPGRCHELTGDRKGKLALDQKGQYRLIFEPAHDPVPEKVDGGLDWGRVTAVRICEMGVDYHG